MPPQHGGGGGGGGGGRTNTGSARRRSSRSNNGGIRPAFAMMKWAVVTGMAVFSGMTLVVLFYHHGMVEPTGHHISLWGAGHRGGGEGYAAGRGSGRGGDSPPAAADRRVKFSASVSSSSPHLRGNRKGSYAGQPAGTAAAAATTGAASWRRSSNTKTNDRNNETDNRNGENGTKKRPPRRTPGGSDAGDGAGGGKIEIGKKAPAAASEKALTAANDAVLAQQSVIEMIDASRKREEMERRAEEIVAKRNKLGKVFGGRDVEAAEFFDAVASAADAAAAAAQEISMKRVRGGGRRPMP